MRLNLLSLGLLTAAALMAQNRQPLPGNNVRTPLSLEHAPQLNSTLVNLNSPRVNNPFVQARPAAAPAPLKAARVPKGGLRLVGHVSSCKTGTINGIASISTTADDVQVLAGCVGNSPGFAGPDDRFFTGMIEDYGFLAFSYLYEYNTDTWARNDYYMLGFTQLGTAMAYNPADNHVYGSFYSNDAGMTGYQFGKYDYSYLTADRYSYLSTTTICSLSSPYAAMAFTPEGVLYVITADGMLNTANLETGALTPVGDTGVKPYAYGSATIDPATGTFYWNVVPNDQVGYLYTVNTQTGLATLVYAMADAQSILGLFVPKPLAEDGAPAVPENMEVNFTDGALTGTVSFTIPTECYDGTPLQGAVNWQVTMNGAVQASGSGNAGDRINANITLTTADNYETVVSLSNSVGRSPEVKDVRWIGPDTPQAVRNLNLSYTDGTFTLTWSPVTESVHGGYMDPAGVTYRVVHYPGVNVVAEALTECTFTQPVDPNTPLAAHYFSVQPFFDGIGGQITPSNTVSVGVVHPPYEDDFTTDPTGVYTIINANNDQLYGYPCTWEWYNDPYEGVNYVFMNAPEDNVVSDDWFISPAIYLEAGHHYGIYFDVRSYRNTWQGDEAPDNNESHFSVHVGSQPTVEAMTTELVGHTVHVGVTPRSYGGDFVPQTSGLYYMALRSLQPGDYEERGQMKRFYSIYCEKLSVTTGTVGGAPLEPTAMSATTASDGSLTATITMTAPTKDNTGADLTSIDSIIIYRDGDIIGNISSVEPGQRAEYVDSSAPAGQHTYGAAAVNAAGIGNVAMVDCFVGPGTPVQPVDVMVTDAADGALKIEWGAPRTDINGITVDPSKLTYTIVATQGGEETTIARNISATEFSHTPTVSADESAFIFYSIFARNGNLSSNAALSKLTPIGRVERMTFAESFYNGSLSSAFGIEPGLGEWSLALDGEFDIISSQDRDNGMVYYFADTRGSQGSLFTSRVHVEGNSPVFSFWHSTIPDCTNTLSVLVHDGTSAEGEFLGQFTLAGELGWKEQVFDLSEFIGRDIWFEFQTMIYDFSYTLIDNIHVKPTATVNLSLLSAQMPVRIYPDTEVTLNARVENNGTQRLSRPVLILNGNGKELARYTYPLGINAGDKLNISMPVTLNSSVDRDVTWTLTVQAEGEEFPQDNVSKEGKFRLLVNEYPTPNDLTAQYDEQNDKVTLTWSPLSSTATHSGEVMENFESFTNGQNQFDLYPTHDFDALLAGGFDGRNLGIEGLETSFFVLQRGQNGSRINFDTMSGDKVLASVYVSDLRGTMRDEWIVSPRLTGNAQTVSFWAASFSSAYPEAIEVYTSAQGSAPQQMTRVMTVAAVPEQWTLYEVEIPAGTLFFAIRCMTDGGQILMIDDLVYTPAEGSEVELNLQGYNIYRNGVKLNDELLTAPEYVDSDRPGGTYVVTAVYDRGESLHSNEVSVQTAGIDSVITDEADRARYYDLLGRPVATPERGRVLIRVTDRDASKQF